MSVDVSRSSVNEMVTDSDPVRASAVKVAVTLSLNVSLTEPVMYSVVLGVIIRVTVADSESVTISEVVTEAEYVLDVDKEKVICVIDGVFVLTTAPTIVEGATTRHSSKKITNLVAQNKVVRRRVVVHSSICSQCKSQL